MSSAVSLEYLDSLSNEDYGIPRLDSMGKLNPSVLPAGSVETYKGIYATLVLLTVAHPTGSIADYAWVTSTNSFWYWNGGLLVPGWVNQVITEAAYNLLTINAKAAVPYIIIPEIDIVELPEGETL